MIPVRMRLFTFITGLIFVVCSVLPLYAWSQELTDREEALYTTSTLDPQSSSLSQISVRRTEETGDASLYIGLSEVLKLRSSAGGLTPSGRVKVIEERLRQFLLQGGNPRDIRPGEEGEEIVIRTGEAVLVTIDKETAREAGQSSRQLAFLWTNLIRTALAAEPLNRDSDFLVSRGFSPALSQLRDISTAGMLLQGFASWYGPGFHGRRSANGERFNMNELTAAHRTLPFNTLVKVTNTRNGKSAIVRITDRGPFIHNRILDLSKAAAQLLGMVSSGTAPIRMEVIGK